MEAFNRASGHRESLNSISSALSITNGLGPRDTAVGQAISISNVATQSNAINEEAVDILADALCFVAIGTNPTAVAGTSYACAANTTYRFPIKKGDKVSIITSGTTTGTAYVHGVRGIQS